MPLITRRHAFAGGSRRALHLCAACAGLWALCGRCTGASSCVIVSVASVGARSRRQARSGCSARCCVLRAVPRRPASPYPRRGSTRTRGPLVLGPTCDNSSGFSHTPFTRTVLYRNFQMPSRNKMAHLLWWGSLLERGRAPGLCELWRRASRSSPTAPSAAAAASATATVDGAPLLAVSRTSGTLVRRAPSRRPCRYEACR